MLPWVLLGDFNVIAQNSERMGGSDRRDGVSQHFNSWLNTSRLLDLGFWDRNTLGGVVISLRGWIGGL